MVNWELFKHCLLNNCSVSRSFWAANPPNLCRSLLLLLLFTVCGLFLSPYTLTLKSQIIWTEIPHQIHQFSHLHLTAPVCFHPLTLVTSVPFLTFLLNHIIQCIIPPPPCLPAAIPLLSSSDHWNTRSVTSGRDWHPLPRRRQSYLQTTTHALTHSLTSTSETKTSGSFPPSNNKDTSKYSSWWLTNLSSLPTLHSLAQLPKSSYFLSITMCTLPSSVPLSLILTTCHVLLMWVAVYLFIKKTNFHEHFTADITYVICMSTCSAYERTGSTGMNKLKQQTTRPQRHRQQKET